MQAMQAQSNYHAGLAAEAIVARSYEASGRTIACQRWRGKGGEIDLIFEHGDEIVFVEVKRASSFEDAASRITPRQQQRICVASQEYLATQPRGALTPMRVDAALVDGRGAIRIVENAITA